MKTAGVEIVDKQPNYFIYHKTLDKWATKTAEFFPTVSNET